MDNLYKLINTLSLSEKRYIRLQLSTFKADKNQNKLLDIIFNKHIENDTDLRAHLKNAKNILGNLQNEKSYLYKAILNCLINFHLKSSDILLLANLLSTIEVLFNKGLLFQTNRIINRGISISINQGLYQWQLLFLGYKRELVLKNVLNIPQEDIELELASCMQNISYDNNYDIIYLELNRMFFKQGGSTEVNVKTEVRSIKRKLDPIKPNSSVPEILVAKYYLIQANYYALFSDYKSYKSYVEKALVLIKNNGIPSRLGIHYTVSLYNYCSILYANGKHIEFLKATEEFQSKNNDLMGNNIRPLNSLLMMMSANITGNFNKVISQLEPVFKLYKTKKSLLSNESRFMFCIHASILMFYAEKYQQAYEWLIEVMYKDKIKLNVRRDLHNLTFVYSLILHLELGHDDFIPYLYRSAKRFLKKLNKVCELELKAASYTLQLSKVNKRGDSRIKIYKKMSEELPSLITGEYEKLFLTHFDIISWVDTKTTNRNIGQIFKARLNS